MSYQKQNFQSGQILTAAQLNHIEEGIEKVLPIIEEDASKKFLVLDENGTLMWKDEDYGEVIEDQLLFEEFELTGHPTLSPLLKPEIGDTVIFYLDDKIFYGSITENTSTKNLALKVEDNGKVIFSFSQLEPGISASLINFSSLTGHTKIMVRTKKYNKLDYRYLPICSVEGEAYHSINLNNSTAAQACAPLSTAAGYGRA